MKRFKNIMIGILDVILIIFASLLTGLHAIFIVLQMLVEFIDKLIMILAKWLLSANDKKDSEPEDTTLVHDLKELPDYIITPLESVLLHKVLRYYLINKISLVNAVQCFTAALTGNAKLTDEMISDLKLNPESKDLLFKLFNRINRWEHLKNYTLPTSIKVRLCKANINDSEFVHAFDLCRLMFASCNVNEIKFNWDDANITMSLISYFTSSQINEFDDTTRSNLMYYNSRI